MRSFHRLDEVGFFEEVAKKTREPACQVRPSDIDSIREEVALIKDAELQIIAKINSISASNTHCHEKSAEAIKSIRDTLVNVINR